MTNTHVFNLLLQTALVFLQHSQLPPGSPTGSG